jgi:hypothetical protein
MSSGGLGVSDTIEQFFSNQLVSFPEVADELSSLAADYNKKYAAFCCPFAERRKHDTSAHEPFLSIPGPLTSTLSR